MDPLRNSNHPLNPDSANNPKKARNRNERIRGFLTARIITIAATVPVVTILLTIVTVTGITQKRVGNDDPKVASNGTNLPNPGSGTNSSAPTQAGSSSQDRLVPSLGQRVVPTRMNRDLRELVEVPSANPPGFELPEFRRHPRQETDESSSEQAPVPQFDALRQMLFPQPSMPSLNLNFEGQDLTASGCNCSPPDTDGDVGANHFIQMVNSGAFKIWDKSGNTLLATTTLNTLWGSGGSNPCTQAKHFGDGVVFYDHLADRWVLTDFAFGTSGPNSVAPYYQCTAVSQTSDPVSGGWFFYAVQHDSTNTDWLGDYPKFGMWPDAYYSGYNMFCGASSCTFGGRNSFQGVQVVAYDRSQMILGNPITPIVFRLTPAQAGDTYTLIPATFRFGAPPVGRNEFFASIDSPPVVNAFTTLTTVHIWKFHADFTTPLASAFTGPTDVTVNGFTNAWDSTENGAIVPQSGTSVKLDTVGDRLFANLWYQNLSGTESLWATHTINATSVAPTAVRWYQFNVTGNTVATTPVQQGDINGGGAGDGLYRWMPSLAVDASGNMAIGYSVSSSSTFPSIRYNGRLTTDSINTLGQGESTMVTGTGAFTLSTRWGDYSATGLDPSNGCTFWHTNEYMLTGSTSNWKTRVGSFSYPACVAANDGTITGTITDSVTSNPIGGVTVTVAGAGSATTNGSGVYTITLLPGTYNLTAAKAGYANGTANGVVVTQGNTTIQNFSLVSNCSPVARTWIGAGAGGAGTNFNTATNWSPNGVPQPCDNLTMTLTSGATITLGADSEIHNLTTSLSGANNVFRLDVGTRTLKMNGTTSANVTSGNGNTQMQFNVGASPGQIIYGGDATFAAAAGVTFPILGVGSTTGQVVFLANATFNAGSGTSAANTPAKVIFDAASAQTITDNAGTAIILLGNTSTEIGMVNSPTVTVAGSASNFQPQGNLNVNGTSTLDLTTKTFNRSAAGGIFSLNAGTTLKLAANTGGQTGSNFPLNFTTNTLNATSTVDYNGVVAQTIFATPPYGNLKISNASTKSATAALTVVSDITIGTGATLDQGTTASLSAATFSVGSGATLRNLGTGDMTVGAGGVTNNGTINFDGGGGGCGSADSILIRSSVNGVQRPWSGNGTFSISDVDVMDQGGTAIVTVFSGTNSGNNGSNWVFINGCTGATGKTYVWAGPMGNDSWANALNWKVANSSPAVPRTIPANTDVMIFDGSSTPSPTVSAIPTQTIAGLRVINNAFPSFSSSVASTLTIDPGAGGLGFDVGFLNVTGANALSIKLATGSGMVTGTMVVSGGGHRLISNNLGAITFPSGAIFTTNTGFTGNAFGTGAVGDGAAGSVVFQSGATYNHNAGASPFGASGNPSVVTFQSGSFANYFTATGFDASGRTYATLTIGKGDPGGIAVNASQTGSSGNFQFDNLVINNTGSANSSLTFSTSGTITIRGNITSVGAGSGGTLPDVIFTAGAGGVIIDKQGGGTVTFGNSLNTRTAEFESNATVNSGTTLVLARPLYLGIVQPSSFVCTVNGALSGSASGYLIGNEKRPFSSPSNFTYHLGTPNGYSPLDANVTAGSGDLTVAALQGAQPILNSSTSLQRYWRITEGGAVTSDLTLHYLDPTDIAGNENNYQVIVVEAGSATRFPPDATHSVNTTNNTATILGIQNFSDWTLGEPNAPTAVKLTGFTAKQVNDEVTLQWRTGYEVRNLGYNIYREQNGKREAITPSLIAGSALMVGSSTVMNAGHSYTWYDHNNFLSNTTYWLEDVDVDGTRTLHGPIAPSIDYSLTRKDRQSETFDDLQRLTPACGRLISGWPAAFTEEQTKLLASPKASTKSPSQLTQRDIANIPGVKIAVTKLGWYRVTVADLLAAGFNPRDQVTNLQLYANAKEVPIKLSGDGTLATNSDYFEFYGHGLDSPTDAAQTYYLIIGKGAGKRISVSSGSQPGEPSGPNSFDYTLERKDRLIYYAGLLNGDVENIFGGLVRGTLAAETLPVTRLDTAAAANGAQAVLEVSLVGVTKQTHDVLVTLNGQDVGTVDFSNNENPSKTFSVAASLLTEGENTLRLTALNGNLDISLIDTVQLTYPHLYAADNNALFISVDSARTKRITGFTDSHVRAVDITSPTNIVELQPVVNQDGAGNYSADLQVSTASKRNVRTLLVFADSATAQVDRIKTNQPSSWWSHTSGDDYLIITSNELRGSVEPLAAFRRSQGLVVDVIDVEDLYDEFSYGQHSPTAIRDFLQTAVTSWQRKPHYVLLAGDSSLDPNNYLGQGLPDVVPTKLLDTTLMETASDDWLADFDNDAIADLAIGRLPVSTTAAMDLVVAKIIAYENMAPDPSRGVTLVADNTFESASDALLTLLPSSTPVLVINRSTADDATIHNQIIQSLNQGPTVSNYFGHGSNDVWTGAGLLSSEDAPALANQNRLTVFVMMTCFNGYFQDIFSESLSEALLKSPGGAVSVWASSGMTEPGGQSEIDQALFSQLFGGTSPTLGDAVRAAKRTTMDRDVRLTWILFGDPATRLR